MPGIIQEQLAGCIKWLPPRDMARPDGMAIDEGCYEHPVVILSSWSHNGVVEICIITSFGGQDLETKYRSQQHPARAQHLPISPSQRHPDNGVLLVLSDNTYKMRKKSYIKMAKRHSIALASLRPYDRERPDIFLSKRSYKTLVKHARFTEPPQPPSSSSLSLPYGRAAPGSPLRLEPDLERSIGGRGGRGEAPQSPTAVDYASLVSYYARRAAEDIRSHGIPQRSSRIYSAETVPITAAYSSPPQGRRQQQLSPPLPPSPPRRVRYYNTLPTTEPIRETRGRGPSEPSSSWWIIPWMLIVLGILIFLGIAYGLYRGGRWALAWAREVFGSTVGNDNVKSLRSLFLQMVVG